MTHRCTVPSTPSPTLYSPVLKSDNQHACRLHCSRATRPRARPTPAELLLVHLSPHVFSTFRFCSLYYTVYCSPHFVWLCGSVRASQVKSSEGNKSHSQPTRRDRGDPRGPSRDPRAERPDPSKQQGIKVWAQWRYPCSGMVAGVGSRMLGSSARRSANHIRFTVSYSKVIVINVHNTTHITERAPCI